MNNCITLKAAIDGVLSCQKENGHSELYLIDLRRTYNRLLVHAEKLGTDYLSDELVELFLSDSSSSRSGEYRHERFLAHNRCIRFLKCFLETGKVSINKYHEPVPEMISEGLALALSLYDHKEEASGLSQASLIKNRRPIRYLLEYMTSLGYENLSDIRPGDTMAAVEDMLEKHYDPTSLVTAISGMRRFYEMFPEIQQYRLEIPARMPRKRSIIDVYSEEEQNRISAMLSSPDISRRDASICLLSFETGLRSVDICNLRLSDVDWKHSVINIVQSKTKKPLNLPIRSSYGNAMVDYLLKERPACREDYFFLSVNAPYVKLNTTWHIVRSVVSAAGVETTGRLVGTRMFRHNAASTMLRKGVPLPAISEELGHKNPDSTMVYLSTDQETMSSLTLPLPKEGDKD
jgi:site-specific recombinase XerD